MPSRHQQDPHATARAAVTAQRGYRSIREVSAGSGVTNSTWGNFENGRSGLTRNIRHAVMRAYDWPPDWPENPPPITSADAGQPSLEDRLSDIVTMLEKLTDLVQAQWESREQPPRRRAGGASP